MGFENELFKDLDKNLEYIDGGITAPGGFSANAVYCGLKKKAGQNDLMLIKAEQKCAAAAVYTKNKTAGAPITVTREHLADGIAQVVICNAGNANTCNRDGVEKAERICEATAKELGIDQNDVIIASTGVIGQPLDAGKIIGAVKLLADGLTDSAAGSNLAAGAILTTDTVKKEYAAEFKLGGKKVKIGGICKGSGMINPNMATMLCFMTTDAVISAVMLDASLREACSQTLNMISVDGDTSTNDMACVMASAKAGNVEINQKNADYKIFTKALTALMHKMAKAIAADGEGATKLIECRVNNAKSSKQAKAIAKSIVNSMLVKSMIFGADANWGRILCAIGYAGEETDIEKIDVAFLSKSGIARVCENGYGLDFSEDEAKRILSDKEIIIDVDLKSGRYGACAWGCDLTYDYVRINGDYRS